MSTNDEAAKISAAMEGTPDQRSTLEKLLAAQSQGTDVADLAEDVANAPDETQNTSSETEATPAEQAATPESTEAPANQDESSSSSTSNEGSSSSSADSSGTPSSLPESEQESDQEPDPAANQQGASDSSTATDLSTAASEAIAEMTAPYSGDQHDDAVIEESIAFRAARAGMTQQSAGLGRLVSDNAQSGKSKEITAWWDAETEIATDHPSDQLIEIFNL